MEFFRPDLYHKSVEKGRLLFDKLTKNVDPMVVPIPA